MLQIKNLTVSLKKDLRTILEDFTFTLNGGDKAVIVGEEGNGKSTLLKLIYDPTSVADYAEYSGEIAAHGTRFGYLAQEMDAGDKALSVCAYYAAVPGFYERTPKELSSVAARFGFTADFFYEEQSVGSLSGGERVKLQLMRLLIEQPDVLLMDEPSNDIDIETLRWLEDFINASARPVLFVSHDETLIENTANVIIHIEQVRRKTMPRYTVARMPYREYVDTRLRKLSHQEQVAREEKRAFDAKVERFQRIQQSVEYRQETISRGDPHGGRLLKKKMKAVKSLEKRIDREGADMTQLPDVEEAILMKFDAGLMVPNGKTIVDLELPELSVGGKALSRNVKLNVTGPEKVCIIGKNGIGKTTLLRQLAESLLERSDVKCGYMPQNYEELLDMAATPVEFLNYTGEKAERTKIRSFFGSMKYTSDEMEHAIGALSGGQKAKLMFIKMILDGCNVLVLDEPTRNFSPMSNPVIREVLRDYRGAILSVSHDRKFIAEVSTKVYRLTEDGLEVVDKDNL
jgi:ATPase subunit of ABC transporter with duplicated ATPase domains